MPGAAILEREAELRRITAAVEGAREGRGRLIILEGAAGIGKSAVLAAGMGAATASGARVLRARGAELERDFAFGVVRQLLEPALAELSPAARDDVFQGPAAVAGCMLGLPGAGAHDGTEEGPAHHASFAVLHGLYWLCANLATPEEPLVLAVDDAHFADAASLRFLAFLLPRLDQLPVAVVITTLPEPDPEVAAVLGVLLADGAAWVLRPAPLSPEAVGELLELGLGRTPDPAFAAACHRATAGLPFLVDELVAAACAEDVEPDAAAAREVDALGARTIGRTIALRLARLPGDTLRMARAIAVLETAELAQAADLADLDRDDAAAAVDQLVAAGILEPALPLAFVQPIVRAGVLAELPAPERAAADRCAAELLDGREGTGERVAEHLLATEPAQDPWVVDRLTTAARTALQRGAPESAATYLRRALAEPPAAELRPPLLADLGIAELTAGRSAGAARLREVLASGADDELRVRSALALAHHLGRAEQMAAAVEVIDGAAAALREPDGPAGALLEAITMSAAILDASMAARLRPRLDAMRRAADDPAAPRETLGVAALVAVHRNEPAAVAAGLAQRALAAGPRIVPSRTDAPWYAQATLGLIWADAHEPARIALDAGVDESRRTGNPVLFAISLAHRSWLQLRRGDLPAAEADARAVFEMEQITAPPLYRKLAAAILVNTFIDQGDFAAAEEVVGQVGVDEFRRTHSAAVLQLARGRLRLAQMAPAAALDDALAAGEIAVAGGALGPGYLAWRSTAALAYAMLGDRASAVRLAEEEVALARASGGHRTLGVALRAAGVVVGGDEGEELLRESVANLERSGVLLERARALTELGALLRRSNRRREARDLLAEALDVAQAAGARPLQEQAETELRATGARPRRAALRGIDALTASERRVAELAAEGLTNREIAQALFVTMRTVEGHLTRVFSKLDVTSRRELPDALR